MKTRVVWIADGTISTRYNPQSPLLVAILIDMHGNVLRGYSFNQKRVAIIRSLIKIDDIVFIHNAEIENTDQNLTWVKTPIQLKFLDSTKFQVTEQDATFPGLTWLFKTIPDIANEETTDVIGISFF